MTRPIAAFIAGRRTKYLVLAIWLLLLAAAAPFAGQLIAVEKNDSSSWLPAGAETTKLLDLQSTFGADDTMPVVVLYTRDSGLTAADRAKITADAPRLAAAVPIVGQITGPVFADDGKAAQTVVPVSSDADDLTASDAANALRAVADDGTLTVHMTGPGGNAADLTDAFGGIDSTLLYATIAIVIVILLFTYRSPFLWLLPIVSAGVALSGAEALIYFGAKYAGVTVNFQSAGILTAIVFGAGTDYALLLVARYREELHRHEDRHAAMTEALHRSAPAVIASAATVACGMLCLLVADTNSTKGLGPVLACGVLVALIVMITLLPALMVTVGRWVFWPRRPVNGTETGENKGVWAAIGRLVERRARSTWLVTTALLLVLAAGNAWLHADGLTNAGSFTGKPDSVAGEELLARHFPAGEGTPVVVVAKGGAADAVAARFQQTPGITAGSVTPPVSARGYVYLQGTLADAADSPAAYDTVQRLRDRVHAVPGADALVGGTTAVNLDLKNAAERDRTVIIPIVLAVILLILVLVLRSLIAPLMLMATVVLSFAAALGASAVLFRFVLHFAGSDTSYPLFVFVFLVALGVDYNIFLMTRIHEEAGRHGTARAVFVGLTSTGGVITSAGLVLAGTFAVLATLPVTAFAELGFTIAFGVLLDTFVVRSILVTSLSHDLGRRIWFPSRLWRQERAAAAEPAEEVPALRP